MKKLLCLLLMLVLVLSLAACAPAANDETTSTQAAAGDATEDTIEESVDVTYPTLFTYAEEGEPEAETDFVPEDDVPVSTVEDAGDYVDDEEPLA